MKSKSKRNNTAASIIFFALSGIVFITLTAYIARGSTNPEFYWKKPSISPPFTAPLSTNRNHKFILEKNRAAVVNSVKIVYKGSINGQVILDCYILKLDPQYAYTYLIPAGTAKKQFLLGGSRFRLLVSNKKKISIQALHGP